MRPLRLISPLVLVLACASSAFLPAAQPFPAATDPDWTAIVGGYPGLGTPQSQQELAILHWLQDTRIPAEVARAGVESGPDLALFLDALGSAGEASDYPGTVALLKQARHDLKPVVAALKQHFSRPRPYVTDPTLTPALPEDDKYSFPSKHAALGTLFAALLIQLDPADQDLLAREGKLIGDDRVMAGLHWPSDDTAGRRLGKAFATHWLALPGNGQMLQDAAGEWPDPAARRLTTDGAAEDPRSPR